MKIESPQEMQTLGESIAGVVRGGDVLILTGELGAGKTTFAQGVARGLGITEPVTSPTFVMSKSYSSVTSLGLLHLDVYRVGAADQLLDLWSELDAENSVTLVEWGIPWAGEFGDCVAEMRIDSEHAVDFSALSLLGELFLGRIESVLT